MTPALVAQSPGTSLPTVTGYVEAATTDRILGWAWSPGEPGERVRIELHLGDTIVAETVADLPRPDLASNGVGDGRHAYDIAIPPECRARAAELRVLARTENGDPIPLGAPPAADSLGDQVGRMLRGMDALVNSQRVMHRNLQAALTTKSQSDSEATAAALARVVELSEETARQLQAVERFVVRLDEALARFVPTADASGGGATIPKLAAYALGIAAAALAVSIFGLLRSLGG